MHQVFSAEQVKEDEYLADTNQLKKMYTPTPSKPKQSISNSQIQVNILKGAKHDFFSFMYSDEDSVFTFHPSITTTDSTSHQPSSVFTPKLVSQIYHSSNKSTHNFSVPIDADGEEDNAEVVSNISATGSGISTLETQIKDVNTTLKNISRQSRKEAQENARILASI